MLRGAIGVIVGGLVLFMFVSLGVFNTATKTEVRCGPWTTVPKIERYLDVSENLGKIINDLSNDVYTPRMVVDKMRKTFSLMGLFKQVFQAASIGETEPEAATGWRRAAEDERARQLASCCVTYTGPDQQDPGTDGGSPDGGAPFDPRSVSLSQNNSASSGGETAVWEELRRQGLSELHAAAVMGNMQVESGFSATIVQGGRQSNDPSSAGRGGYGLVQWTPGRKLEGYIGSAQPTVGNEVAALLSQLAGNGPYPEKAAGRAFYAARTLDEATRVFHLQYERSASKNSNERIRNARAIMQRNSTGETPSTPDGGPGLTIPSPDGSSPDQSQCQQGGTGTGGTFSGIGTGLLNGTPTIIATLNPKGAGNWQAGVKAGSYWYVAQATTGNKATIIHRLNESGTEVDQMKIQGGGRIHPTTFGVVGNTVYVDASRVIRSYRYRPGVTVAGASGVETGWTGEIAIDPTGKTAAIRNGNRYELYDMTTRKQIGKRVRTPAGMRQGVGVSGRVLYVLSGTTNSRAWVDSYSFTTGNKIATKNITHLGEGRGSHREPEGMHGNVLGVKVGTGDKRRLLMYDLRDAAPTSIGGGGTPSLSGTAPAGWPIRSDGMAPNTARGRLIINATFQMNVTVAQCAIQRGGHVPDSYHYTGHACDIMVGIPKGKQIAAWAIRNHAQLGVVQVIHNRQIWTLQRSSEGWRPYSGPSEHTDHVHLSFDRSRRI